MLQDVRGIISQQLGADLEKVSSSAGWEQQGRAGGAHGACSSLIDGGCEG